jgi:hypothetical protein
VVFGVGVEALLRRPLDLRPFPVLVFFCLVLGSMSE